MKKFTMLSVVALMCAVVFASTAQAGFHHRRCCYPCVTPQIVEEEIECKVMVPVWSDKEVEYTVCVPTLEEREGTCTKYVAKEVTETVDVCVDNGCWEDVCVPVCCRPKHCHHRCCCCSTTMICKRWVPKMETVQKDVTRIVCEPQEETYTYNVCVMKPETRTRTVKVCQWQEETRIVKVCKYVYPTCGTETPDCVACGAAADVEAPAAQNTDLPAVPVAEESK